MLIALQTDTTGVSNDVGRWGFEKPVKSPFIFQRKVEELIITRFTNKYSE
jgi:hypothetical protein